LLNVRDSPHVSCFNACCACRLKPGIEVLSEFATRNPGVRQEFTKCWSMLQFVRKLLYRGNEFFSWHVHSSHNFENWFWVQNRWAKKQKPPFGGFLISNDCGEGLNAGCWMATYKVLVFSWSPTIPVRGWMLSADCWVLLSDPGYTYSIVTEPHLPRDTGGRVSNALSGIASPRSFRVSGEPEGGCQPEEPFSGVVRDSGSPDLNRTFCNRYRLTCSAVRRNREPALPGCSRVTQDFQPGNLEEVKLLLSCFAGAAGLGFQLPACAHLNAHFSFVLYFYALLLLWSQQENSLFIRFVFSSLQA
jgi:hypothetical protein